MVWHTKARLFLTDRPKTIRPLISPYLRRFHRRESILARSYVYRIPPWARGVEEAYLSKVRILLTYLRNARETARALCVHFRSLCFSLFLLLLSRKPLGNCAPTFRSEIREMESRSSRERYRPGLKTCGSPTATKEGAHISQPGGRG